MKHCYYKIYSLLRNGEEALVEQGGVMYRFQFQGNKIGSESYLRVINPKGEEKKFGWGWGYEEVMRALHHLEQGWDTEQRPPFHLYNHGHPD